MKSLCIIPARGGSKRIPYKNIKLFRGIPIINYSIQYALSTTLFDKVMVSTDNEDIAQIARDAGADVPFLRSPATSNDISGLAEVMVEVLTSYSEMKLYPERITCILPTAPLLNTENLYKAFNLLDTYPEANAVLPIVRFSYPIQRSLQVNDKGYVSMVWPENLYKRSQDLEDRFHDAAQFYLVRSAALIKYKSMHPAITIGIEIPESQVQDIDNLEDWKLAELKFRYMKEKGD